MKAKQVQTRPMTEDDLKAWVDRDNDRMMQEISEIVDRWCDQKPGILTTADALKAIQEVFNF